MPCLITLRSGERLQLDLSVTQVKALRKNKRILRIAKEPTPTSVQWWKPLSWIRRQPRPEFYLLNCKRIKTIVPVAS
jgi:hypothetical protein